MFLEVSLRTFPAETASSVRVAIRQKLNNAEKSLKVQLKHQSTSDPVSLPAFTPVDGIWAVMMVWRLRGKIITIVLCCIAYDICWMWTVVKFACWFTFRFCFFGSWLTSACFPACVSYSVVMMIPFNCTLKICHSGLSATAELLLLIIEAGVQHKPRSGWAIKMANFGLLSYNIINYSTHVAVGIG